MFALAYNTSPFNLNDAPQELRRAAPGRICRLRMLLPGAVRQRKSQFVDIEGVFIGARLATRVPIVRPWGPRERRWRQDHGYLWGPQHRRGGFACTVVRACNRFR